MTTFDSKSLLDALNHTINIYIDKYIDEISSRHNLSNKTELKNIWIQISNQSATIILDEVKNKKSNGEKPVMKNNKKKVSSYVVFCNKYRSKLKKENPQMTFGEISKNLGKMWSNLSSDEQLQYKYTDDLDNKDEIIITTTATNKLSSFSKLTIAELKNECDKYNLKKSGNKNQLIERLMEHLQESNNSTDMGDISEHNNTPKAIIFHDNKSVISITSSDTDNSTDSFIIDENDDVTEFDLNYE